MNFLQEKKLMLSYRTIFMSSLLLVSLCLGCKNKTDSLRQPSEFQEFSFADIIEEAEKKLTHDYRWTSVSKECDSNLEQNPFLSLILFLTGEKDPNNRKMTKDRYMIRYAPLHEVWDRNIKDAAPLLNNLRNEGDSLQQFFMKHMMINTNPMRECTYQYLDQDEKIHIYDNKNEKGEYSFSLHTFAETIELAGFHKPEHTSYLVQIISPEHQKDFFQQNP